MAEATADKTSAETQATIAYDQLKDARHLAASAAGEIANVAAQVSRALAWPADFDSLAAFESYLRDAESALQRAGKALNLATSKVVLAKELKPDE